MSVRAVIVNGPLGAGAPVDRSSGAGASVVFEGIVRPLEDGRVLSALEYEAYEPMASRQLSALGESIVREHGLIGLTVEHSTGRVDVGEVSFRLTITGRHRGECLRAMAEFIDAMKRDVPIWKTPVWR